MRRYVLAAALGPAVLLSMGCMTVDVGPVGIDAPVLMGPIERIADTQPRRGARLSVGEIKAKASVTAMGAGGSSQHPEGGYIVTETQSASAYVAKDDVAAEIYGAWSRAGARSSDIVYIDDLRARAWFQNYVFLMVGGVNVKVRGEVTRSSEELR